MVVCLVSGWYLPLLSTHHMDLPGMVHGVAVLEECDRADLFSSELESRISYLVCNLCQESCPHLQAWRLHCVTDHSTVPGYCPTILSSGLGTARQERAGVECPECGVMFSSEEEMSSHLLSQTRTVRLVCGQCGAHWPDLESHLLSHHAQDTTCSICREEVQDLLEHHHTTHQGFASVIAETEVRCAGDGETLEYFQTVLATKVRFLATEVKPEDSLKREVEVEVTPQQESLPKITHITGSYPQNESKISSEEERNSYNVQCYERLHTSSDHWKVGLGRNCCEICGFVPYTKNKYREKQDHMAKSHFKERIDSLLPTGSPYQCPDPECQYRGKDKQDIQRHYTGKHNILKMWVDSFLREQASLLGSSQNNKQHASRLGGKKSEWEMTFQEMESIAIQKEEKRKEKKRSLVDEIKSEIDLSNSCISISKVTSDSTPVSPLETPPSISLIRIKKDFSCSDPAQSSLR